MWGHVYSGMHTLKYIERKKNHSNHHMRKCKIFSACDLIALICCEERQRQIFTELYTNVPILYIYLFSTKYSYMRVRLPLFHKYIWTCTQKKNCDRKMNIHLVEHTNHFSRIEIEIYTAISNNFMMTSNNNSI